jgi:dihydrofolate reductase
MGGAKVISELINNKLIDEIRVAIQPIVLGKGIPLFKNMPGEVRLDLKKTDYYDYGIVEFKYGIIK